jgi:hypothetical protein
LVAIVVQLRVKRPFPRAEASKTSPEAATAGPEALTGLVEYLMAMREMQVRILPIAQQRRESRVAMCGSHKVVKGQVERSMKDNGTVVRKRRCDVCGDLIKTIEMTEDQLAHIRVKFENENRELRAEMVQCRTVVETVERMFGAMERVRKELRIRHEVMEEKEL